MKARKSIVVLMCIFLMAVLLCGCGQKHGKVVYDEDGNVSITSKWVLEEFTTNGTTTVIADESPLVQALFSSRNPSFSCPDGVNCVFRSNKKDHKGTVTKQDGIYYISFVQGTAAMEGEIVGKKLFIKNTKGTLSFVFSAE